MKLPSFNFPEKLLPYKGVIIFFVVLMGANLFWKYNIMGDDSMKVDSMVTIWGMDISAPFTWMALHVARITTFILHSFGSTVVLEHSNVLRYPNGNSVLVIWACTGIKQAYITFCILAFARGPLIKKIWFIPLSLIVVYAFNIFRITFIVACIENHPDWFDFLHLYAFKYVFYGIIFLMWVWWEEKIVGIKEIKKSVQV